MKLSEKGITIIIILTTILWTVINVLGWSGNHMLGLYLGVILMLLYMVLGVANKGVVSKKFLFYPLAAWSITWIIGFFLANYYGIKFAGAMPSFTILGFHPSFAPVVFLYWIGGMLTLTLGFMFFKDEWMSDKDWNDFKEKIRVIKEQEKKGAI
ncbi:hypothetical protein [Senegalia massiliensis]|uniref:hypothetical protein n=1 Tax=Senegalia massiliensis TaxID=1720316 RepID=UPI001031FAF2|nr:hypothetical protein [Senegalia massiliensis]